MSVDVIMSEEHELRPPLNSPRQEEFLTPLKRRREFRPLDSRRHEFHRVKRGGHGFVPSYSSAEFLFRFFAAKLSTVFDPYNQNESDRGGGEGLGREMEHKKVSVTCSNPSPITYHLIALITAYKLLTYQPMTSCNNSLQDMGQQEIQGRKIVYEDAFGVYYDPVDDDDYDDFDDFDVMDDDDDDDDDVMDDDDDDEKKEEDDDGCENADAGADKHVDMDDDEKEEDDDGGENANADAGAGADKPVDMDLSTVLLHEFNLKYPAFPLVEVFSVVVNINKNITSQCVISSLYGRILVHDRENTGCIIYKKEREDSKPKFISLSGGGDENTTASLLQINPSRPIYACDALDIIVDLMEKNRDTNLSSPDKDSVFCSGRIFWHFLSGFTMKFNGSTLLSQIRYRARAMYDLPLSTKFKGQSGSVEVKYVMWNCAVGAEVEVTLLDSDGADVYGLIQATSRRCKFWSVLFQKEKSDESIDVGPGELIPLSRSLVTINCFSTLTVSIALYDRRRFTHLSQDGDGGEIANDCVDFETRNSGTEEKNISGRYGGGVKVKVTWRAW